MLLRQLCILISAAMVIGEVVTVTNSTKPADSSKISNTVKKKHFGKITDITSNVTLYDMRIIQLQISWRDNLPNDTLYNIIVSADNSTTCSDPPCSVYSVRKPKEFTSLPDTPASFIEFDERDCNYMFGCNYSVIVETSKAGTSRKEHLMVPYCLHGICSCQIRPRPPKVNVFAKMPDNATIQYNWNIPTSSDLFKNYILPENVNNYRLHVKVSEQGNPSLSWGGILSPVLEKSFGLANLKYKEVNHTLQGYMTFPLRPLREKAVLSLMSYLTDEYGCKGNEILIKVKVPPSLQNKIITDDKLRNALIAVSTFFVLVLFVGAFILRRRNQRKLLKAQMKRDDLYLKPLSRHFIQMEENINYVPQGHTDVFELPHTSISIGPQIGEGAFGRVYKATAINLRPMPNGTTHIVAVKQLKKNPTADEIAEFLSEIQMLKGVGRHINIVCFLGCCTIRAPYLMIMEYVGRGNLLSYLRAVRQEATKFNPKNANYTSCKVTATPTSTTNAVKYIELKLSEETIDTSVSASVSEIGTRQPKPSFTETTYSIIDDDEVPFEYILDNKELHNFALQIANGMRFLEEQEITHRDLAARNVLIDDRKTLKISDFGLSRHGIYTNTKTRKLPLRWLSIEAIRDNIYSSKSDIWAYAVVLWEIGTLGASPYPTISNNELIPFLLAGKRLEKPEICTDQVYAIMLQCWTDNPEERPTFEDLYKVLCPKSAYVDINSLSDDYVFPPIKETNNIHY